VREGRGRRSKYLLVDHKETRGCWKLREKVVDRTVWLTRCGKGYGPVVKTDCGMNRLTLYI